MSFDFICNCRLKLIVFYINFLSLLILLYISCVPPKEVLKLRILWVGLIYSEGKTKLYYMRPSLTQVAGKGQG